MCPMCMATIVATVVGLGSAGSITAFVATKLRFEDPRAGPAEDGPLNALGGHAPESTETGDLAAGGAHAWGATSEKKTG